MRSKTNFTNIHEIDVEDSMSITVSDGGMQLMVWDKEDGRLILDIRLDAVHSRHVIFSSDNEGAYTHSYNVG